MTSRGYPGAGYRYWFCPSCKTKRRGDRCKPCNLKREDAERWTKDRTAAASAKKE